MRKGSVLRGIALVFALVFVAAALEEYSRPLPSAPGRAATRLQALLPAAATLEAVAGVADSLELDVRPFHEPSGRLVAFWDVRSWNPMVDAVNRVEFFFGSDQRLDSLSVNAVYTSF